MAVCYRCVCSYNGGTEGSCEIVQSKHPFQGDLQADKVSSQTALGPVEASNKRKVLWKHNITQTNRVSPTVQENRAAKREIVRDRNVNASSASARSRAAEDNPVAANKAAVSKADDKADCLPLASGGRRLPPLVYARTAAEGFRRCLNALFITWKRLVCFHLERVTSHPHR